MFDCGKLLFPVPGSRLLRLEFLDPDVAETDRRAGITYHFFFRAEDTGTQRLEEEPRHRGQGWVSQGAVAGAARLVKSAAAAGISGMAGGLSS